MKSLLDQSVMRAAPFRPETTATAPSPAFDVASAALSRRGPVTGLRPTGVLRLLREGLREHASLQGLARGARHRPGLHSARCEDLGRLVADDALMAEGCSRSDLPRVFHPAGSGARSLGAERARRNSPLQTVRRSTGRHAWGDPAAKARRPRCKAAAKTAWRLWSLPSVGLHRFWMVAMPSSRSSGSRPRRRTSMGLLRRA